MLIIKILRINTSNSQGGAAHSAANIQEKINEVGADSWFYSISGETNIEKKNIPLGEGAIRRYSNVLAYRLLGKEGYLNKSKWNIVLKQLDDFDIIHLHNAHGYYLPLDVLEKLMSKPCVWTLHDYWLVTGGVGFPKTSYQKKPMLEQLFPFANFHYPAEWMDRSEKRKKIIVELVDQHEPSLVAVSNTMAMRLRSLGLTHRKLNVIYHGLFDDGEALSIAERTKMREKNNLPSNKHIFLFVSAQVDNPIKGFDIFRDALYKLDKSDSWIALVVGDNYKKEKSNTDLSNIYFLGKLPKKKVLELYKSCDTYVAPSLDETYGRTVVEATAEGAEVVCSDISIFHEVTFDKATYFKPADSSDLSMKLKETMINPLSDLCRKNRAHTIRTFFSGHKMAKKYIELYEKEIKI